MCRTDAGDFVKVQTPHGRNLRAKMGAKVHFRSSNRPGGIKRIPVAKLRKENPGEIIRHAVKYMLPKIARNPPDSNA